MDKIWRIKLFGKKWTDLNSSVSHCRPTRIDFSFKFLGSSQNSFRSRFVTDKWNGCILDIWFESRLRILGILWNNRNSMIITLFSKISCSNLQFSSSIFNQKILNFSESMFTFLFWFSELQRKNRFMKSRNLLRGSSTKKRYFWSILAVLSNFRSFLSSKEPSILFEEKNNKVRFFFLLSKKFANLEVQNFKFVFA